MLNSQLKEDAINKLNDTVNRHIEIANNTKNKSIELFEARLVVSTTLIKSVEDYFNKLSNSPKEFDKTVREYRIEVNRFDKKVKMLNIEAANVEGFGAGVAAGGAAIGIGVSALAPTAALAVATTFGTASTGVAISTLGGAAATNAALAWLGGGALAAGGGGMAAGNALLAAAGPVGWVIGGATILGGTLFINSKNKEIAKKAHDQKLNIEADIRSLEIANNEISRLLKHTQKHSAGCSRILSLLRYAPSNYLNFSTSDKENLGSLKNNIESLIVLLQTEVVNVQK